MEVILKSNNEESLAKIVALAKKLNVVIEKKNADFNKTTRANLKNRILNFKAIGVCRNIKAGELYTDAD